MLLTLSEYQDEVVLKMSFDDKVTDKTDVFKRRIL